MPGEIPLSASDQEQLRLRKALRESELLRELSELLASSLDPDHILQVLVKRAIDVCDVERCAVWLLDESRSLFIPSAYHLSAPRLRRQDVQTIDKTWPRSILALDHPLIQHLLREDAIPILNDWHHKSGQRLLAEKFMARSILLVTLRRGERIIGLMSLDNPGKLATFPQELQQLARAMSQQAAVAIDNARLYQQAQKERHRAERLIGRAQSIYQVAMAVNSGEDLTKTMASAAQQLVCGLDARGAAIALLEDDVLSVIGTSGLQPPASSPSISLNDLPHCLIAIQQGEPLFVTSHQAKAAEHHWYRQMGLMNVLVIPLLTGTGEEADLVTCVGFAFVSYSSSSSHPSPHQFAFAQDIATQCAIAIEKTNLLARTHQAATLATERAQALDAVFNAMTEGITVLNLDGQVIVSNKAASYFVGVPPNTSESLTTFLQRHPTYTLQGQPIAHEDFPLTRALRGEQIRAERFITMRADGTERCLEINVAPMFDSEGRQIGLVSAFRDITEQVRVERRIRQALDIMLHAAEAVSGLTDIPEILRHVLTMTLTALSTERGMVLLYDSQTQTFTPLLAYGFEPEDEDHWLEQQQSWLAPHPDQYNGFRNPLLNGDATLVNAEQYPEQPNPFQQTMILAAPIMHDNRLFGVMLLDRSFVARSQVERPRAMSGPLTMPPMRPFNLWDLAVVEGIAQFAGLAIEQTRWQQEAEEARTNEALLRTSNALKDDFLAITAHDFRTPLTVILTSSQMMERTLRRHAEVIPEMREKLGDYISTIEMQARQLTNIVTTFLEVTQLNRGQITLTIEKINLEDIVRQAIADQSRTTSIHKITYQLQASKYPFYLMGDKARLLQVFANLLQNAIKYSPQGGPITMKLAQHTQEGGEKIIEVRIQDRGIGIPKEAQPHLFERFYRAPGNGSNRARGTGLGLYVVAEFLRLHSGTVRVESSGVEGKGSCFILTLPLFIEEESERYE